ncbi:MAG: lipid II:glycine glycyltransferase FemX [Pirellulaceae bacterium]
MEQHPYGSIFHTQAMVQAYRETPGYEPIAIACREEGRIIGLLVSVKINSVGALAGRLGTRCVMFAEPIVCEGPAGIRAFRELLAEHDRRVANHVIFSEIRPLQIHGLSRDLLVSQGYEYFDYHNYVFDIDREPDEIFKSLHSKRRNNLRGNERKGLTVREGVSSSDWDVFYSHLEASYRRSRIPLVDQEHFRSTYENLTQDRCRLTIAELKGEPIGSACHLMHKNRVYCWYAGTKRMPGVYAQVSLVWEAMQWGALHGFELYDFAGAGWDGEDYGPGTFKARFGGEHLKISRYRKVYSDWRMKVAEFGYNVSRACQKILPNR